MEHIKSDSSYTEENLRKAKHSFEVAVLPGLLGRWFSCPEQIATSVSNLTQPLTSSDTNYSLGTESSTSQPTSSTAGIQKYCYCQQDEHGRMIGCDNDCHIYQWFYMACLNLKSFAMSIKWYCPKATSLTTKRNHNLRYTAVSLKI